MRHLNLKILIVSLVLASIPTLLTAQSFDFKDQLFGTPSTLSVNVQSIDTTTGLVTANGADAQGPTTPFTWDWGDGIITTGFFPQQHTYSDPTENYIVEVTSHYSGGGTDTKEIQARFAAPQIAPVILDSDIQVSIPDNDVTLSSRMPGYLPPTTCVAERQRLGSQHNFDVRRACIKICDEHPDQTWRFLTRRSNRCNRPEYVTA